MSREAHSITRVWQYSETVVPSLVDSLRSISDRSSEAVNVILSVFFPGSVKGVRELYVRLIFICSTYGALLFCQIGKQDGIWNMEPFGNLRQAMGRFTIRSIGIEDPSDGYLGKGRIESFSEGF